MFIAGALKTCSAVWSLEMRCSLFHVLCLKTNMDICTISNVLQKMPITSETHAFRFVMNRCYRKDNIAGEFPTTPHECVASHHGTHAFHPPPGMIPCYFDWVCVSAHGIYKRVFPPLLGLPTPFVMSVARLKHVFSSVFEIIRNHATREGHPARRSPSVLERRTP